MAAFDTNRAQAGARPFGFGLTRVIAAFAAWNDARRTRNALNRLSDHELDDIGLCRGDIDRIARGL
ncbi:MAG: DUF1127 domain-containing protein [Paracoccus sp. (in: a-proteobacteria)]|uniref:DUF1127 domain-containing protein n=1 Tax=Paracoccus sp. TaxID=267 RepID=UPI0026DEFA88|nr:DUF1127 domain-containing protein [Paracoccus sp. (in: a-proteobacteria)]MDO5612797.1 DUF1127 domain-containing protein [Paracoccus sp. (in: a-proteobacteria)]